jgi:hypothetical protein
MVVVEWARVWVVRFERWVAERQSLVAAVDR